MKRNITEILVPIVIWSMLPSLMIVTSSQITFAALSAPQAFMNMTEEQRLQAAEKMTKNEKEAIMNEFSKQNTTINEKMNETTMTNNKTAPSGDLVDER